MRGEPRLQAEFKQEGGVIKSPHSMLRRRHMGWLPIVVIVVAVLVGRELGGSDGTIPTSLVVAVAAFAGCGILLLYCRYPMTGLGVLVSVAAFVDFKLIIEARLYFAGLPVNLVDIAALFAIPALLWPTSPREHIHPTLKFSYSAMAIFLLGIGFLPGFMHGVFENGLYDAFRDFRPVILIALSFFLTRKYARSARVWRLLVTIISLGGVYGMIVPILIGRGQRLSDFERYTDIRAIGNGTPSMEFTFISAVALALCGQPLFGRRWWAWALCLLSFTAYVLSFGLTSYIYLVLVPLLCLLMAPVPLRRKLTIGLGGVGVISGMLIIAASSVLSAREGLGLFVTQVLEQTLDLSSSAHLQGRVFSWGTALALLKGVQFLTGVGMGTRVFANTGIDLVGTVVAGEPTYTTYLLGTGLIGVLVLVLLQSRFVRVSFRQMNTATNSYIRAMMLAFVVYGIVTIISSFAHNNFMSPQISVLFGVLLGLADSARALHAKMPLVEAEWAQSSK